MNRQAYPSDLSDTEWQLLEPLLPAPKPGGRPVKYPRREVVNAIMYVLRSGCAWRMLPHDLPPWRTAFHYFRTWRGRNLGRGSIKPCARGYEKPMDDRLLPVSAAIIDSQSVKTTEKGGLVVPQDDAGKRSGDGPQAAYHRGHHRTARWQSWSTPLTIQDRDGA